MMILTGIFSCSRIPLDEEITRQDLYQHIEFLAGDSLRGRHPGTPEDKVAAEYIARVFEQSGLELLYQEGLQPFEVVTHIEAGENNQFLFQNQALHLNEDFIPLSFSASARVSSKVVFAGYGLKIEDESAPRDDYKNMNVEGNIVLILRGAPEGLDDRFSTYTGLRSKAITAKDLGASGVIFVSGPGFDPEDNLPGLDKPEGKLVLPVVQVTRKAANKLLAHHQVTVEALERSSNTAGISTSFVLDPEITLQTDVQTNSNQTYNVVAQLTANPEYPYLVIGAHYDHLGFGGMGTGSRMPDTSAIHHGADDNASGVAAMLEIAQKLAAKKDSLHTNFLFAAFGAEEMGLLGSRHLVNELPIPDTLIHAMINIDMVGRLKEDRSLQVGGVGTSLQADSLLTLLNKDYDFSLGLSPEGYGPSDHSSFYGRNIPVFFYSTGAHVDYHTPNDTVGAINFQGLAEVSRYIYDLAFTLSNEKISLTFREAGPKMPSGDYNRQKLKVTLGIMPDFSGVEKRGLRADLVIPDKPADKAGMESGDIIVAMDGMPVGDIYEYMERLNKLKPGQIITVEVIRKEQRKVLIVKL
jgi:hypothetical protein